MENANNNTKWETKDTGILALDVLASLHNREAEQLARKGQLTPDLVEALCACTEEHGISGCSAHTLIQFCPAPQKLEPGAAYTAAARKAETKEGTLCALVQFPHTKEHYLWLALVDLSGPGVDKLVVWTYNSSDDSFFSGHYFEGLMARPDAYRRFAAVLTGRVNNIYPRGR